MTYTLTNTSAVIRDIDKAYIPADPANTDWQTYQAWLSAPNTPNPVPVPPVVVPQSVSRRQFYQAAAQEGLITQADALFPPPLLVIMSTKIIRGKNVHGKFENSRIFVAGRNAEIC